MPPEIICTDCKMLINNLISRVKSSRRFPRAFPKRFSGPILSLAAPVPIAVVPVIRTEISRIRPLRVRYLKKRP